MIKGIKAVAFDIDGTLYPDIRLYKQMVFYFLRHLPFFIHYNRVRKIMHRTAPLGDFYEYQARLLAEEMKITPAQAKEKIHSICYSGLKKFFQRMKPFKYVPETFQQFKDAGLKLAILSDFPPDQKGDIWGCRELFDVILGSEEIGMLKPSKYCFGILAKELKCKPEEILYVGNSVKYDVRGAKNAGMKAALRIPLNKQLIGWTCDEADICFKNYRQLCKIVL